MKINDGENPTSIQDGFSFKNSATETKPNSLYNRAKGKIVEHAGKYWVEWLFAIVGFIIVFIISKLFVGGLLMLFNLQESYTKLDERTQNKSNSATTEEFDKNIEIIRCKQEALYQRNSQLINIKEFQKQYSNCSTK